MRATLIALLVLLATAPAAAAGQRERSVSGTFNARYCEILEVVGEPPALRVNVWNSLRLSRCPQRRWEAFDAPALAQELGAFAVVLNGPRYFLMDRIRATPAGGVRSFHGMRMRHAATIDIGGIENLVEQPYGERTINRRNTWSWKRGRVVYELLAPGRRRYVMQSYSQQVDPKLTVRKLRSLGKRLDLPADWRFRARRLRRPLDLSVKRRATVIRDELANTYQRAR